MPSRSTSILTIAICLEEILQTGRKVGVINVVHGQAHEEGVQRVFEVLFHLSPVRVTHYAASTSLHCSSYSVSQTMRLDWTLRAHTYARTHARTHARIHTRPRLRARPRTRTKGRQHTHPPTHPHPHPHLQRKLSPKIRHQTRRTLIVRATGRERGMPSIATGVPRENRSCDCLWRGSQGQEGPLQGFLPADP